MGSIFYKKRIRDGKLVKFDYLGGKLPLHYNSSKKEISRYDTYYPGFLIKDDGKLVYISIPSSDIQELYVNIREVVGYKMHGTNYFYDDLVERQATPVYEIDIEDAKSEARYNH